VLRNAFSERRLERFPTNLVEHCQMHAIKSNLLTLLFGCLCLVITFIPSHNFFDFPGNEEQSSIHNAVKSPVHNPVIARTSPPMQSEFYEVEIVNPTIPPQVTGTWNPIKVAAEEIAQFKTQSTNK
jgi:hypothetical protein